MSIIMRFKYPALLILLSFLLIFIWFQNGLILGGGEEGLIFYDPLKSLEISKSTWVEVNTGLPNLYWLPRVSFLLPASILVNNFGLPPYLVQAGLFFILMVIGIVSIYYLTLNLLDKYPSRFLISFTAAIFYLFNPFSVSQIWGRGLYPLFFSFALLPLSLLFLLKGLKHKQFIYITLIVFSSVIFSNAFGTVTFVITYWVVLFLFFFWWLLTDSFKKDKVLFGLSFLSLLSIGWVAVSAWWFLPLAIEGNKVFAGYLINSAENLGTLMGVSRNFTPDIIIRLLQRTYYYDPSAFSPIYISWYLQLISWVPIIFVIYGFYRILKHKLMQFRFFVILLILGLIVSLGANPPFGWLFVWIFERVSILQAFRNPFEKFGLVYALGYSALFAIGLVGFFENKRFRNFGILLVLLITCGIFAWPMWTGRVIAGPDKKIGLDVPIYYKELNEWLKTYGEDYRLLMTPLSSGEGAFYQWGKGARYQGLDPMFFILDGPAVSSSAQIPYYSDFITAVRKYMEKMDVAPSLALLRAKFLVDRKDAILITDRERDHYKFLTSFIFPPKGLEKELKTVCGDIMAEAKSGNVAWIACQIPQEESDFSKIKYLHVKVKTDVPANLEIALRDTKDIRIRWDGRVDPDYHTDTNDWEYITVPLSTPTEYNSAIDFSKSFVLEVLAHPKDEPQKSVGEIKLFVIKLDPGIEKQINEFNKVAEFGNLKIFEPVNFNSPPEFGSLSQLERVNNFIELFDQVNKKRDSINKLGFILPSQNPGKDLDKLAGEAPLQVLDKQKISHTRYWFKVDGEGKNELILLSKTFNPNWKVIEQVEKKDLTGNIFNDIKLLQKTYLSEDNHFVVNGYANLWKVDGKFSGYAVIFMPQVIADIGAKISIFSLVSIFLTWGIIISVGKLRSWKF